MRSSLDPQNALLRFGDDLFRVALLLAPDTESASWALLRAGQSVAAKGEPFDESRLLVALLAALPPERRVRRGLPAWVSPRASQPAPNGILTQIARLPRQQRLALGLTLMRGADAAEAGALLHVEPATIRMQVRDALLALAPQIGSVDRTQLAFGDDIPEACRATRDALMLGNLADADPATRGHLALCERCRAAEKAWQHLTTSVEQALRGALREARLPDNLAERIRTPKEPANARTLLADHRLRIALVALPVLLIIALLILPRTRNGAGQSAALGALPAPPTPHELIERANETLYAVPEGQGVWHARYQIRWSFAGGTYAILAADQWVDPQSNRHRLQLVHQDGGGPYELQLGDGSNTVWYAVGKSYAPSLYLLSTPDDGPFHVRFPATPAEQGQLRQARLRSGAWDLAAAYLRQAAAVQKIRTWGRQRDVDGTVVSLLSFSGASPLAAPPGAPELQLGTVTILLEIDEHSGRLREVRELIGPEGGEQTTRTTWRLLDEEWTNDQAAQVFDIATAWNGIGSFSPRESAADPAQPLAEKRALAPLSLVIQRSWRPLWLPAQPPEGTGAALLLNNSVAPVRSDTSNVNERLTAVYVGEGRRLELRTSLADLEPLTAASDWETSTLNGNRVMLRAGPAHSYQARVDHTNQFGESLVTLVAARGYTRAELLDILATVGPATLRRYVKQAPLVVDSFVHDDARALLLDLLADELPEVSTTRHTIARVFTRQSQAPDPLADPYHRPPYDGMPEHVLQESWMRGTSDGDWQISSSLRDEAGTVLQQQYADGSQNWQYIAPLGQVAISNNSPINSAVYGNQTITSILHMLGCGQATLLERANGGKTIFLSDNDWRAYTCQHPHYTDLLQAQISGFPDWALDQAPFLADVAAAQITTWIDTDAEGRLVRVEVRGGATRNGRLLESWEREIDEVVAPEASAAVFAALPPEAPVRWNNTVGIRTFDSTPRTITLGEALAEAQTPLFGLATVPTSPSATLSNTLLLTPTLRSVEAGPPLGDGPEWYNPDDAFPSRALQHGYATRLIYALEIRDGTVQALLYEGPANVFGAYLRATARWQSSAPTTLRVGDRDVPAWQVAGIEGGRWTLFEVDGTLIALEFPFEQAAEVATQLIRLGES